MVFRPTASAALRSVAIVDILWLVDEGAGRDIAARDVVVPALVALIHELLVMLSDGVLHRVPLLLALVRRNDLALHLLWRVEVLILRGPRVLDIWPRLREVDSVSLGRCWRFM